MNLEYPLDDKGYSSFQYTEIIKCKENKLIIIGWNASETQFSAIVLPKVRVCDPILPLKECLLEFGPAKSLEEIKRKIEEGVGVYHEKEFIQGYYLTYIKEAVPIAKIGRHKVYELKATETIQLFDMRSDGTQDSEKKYRKILSDYKVENFYFSYTYDLTNSLAKNMVNNSLALFNLPLDEAPNSPYTGLPQTSGICEMFQYNYNLVQEFGEALVCKGWVLAIIHGFAKHVNLKLKGTIFNLIVIARRSRHHAGTRYIKRGLSSSGFVANYVEVEQIVVNYSISQDQRPICSSFIQVRGSVPTYWMQKPNFANPKPAIELRRNADYMCLGTRRHFHNLICRYGRIIFCVNLMKKKEKTARESELSKEYRNAITMINSIDLKEENALHYSEIDMKFELKTDKKAFVQQIKTFAYFAVQKTGMFMCLHPSTSSYQQLVEFQDGLIRANCVDCLDRTNSFQQLVGETILAVQLNRLTGEDVRLEQLELDSGILAEYSKLYEEMGDLISIQYGSSLAHKQKIQKTTESRFEFLTSITRHVNNTLRDDNRQIEIDVFLGLKPEPNGPQIWQIKQVIEHYPDAITNTFEKMEKGEWFNKAYEYFLSYYRFKDYKKLMKDSCKEMSLSKIEKLSKEQLIHRFRAEIVSSLINDKEEPVDCCWLIEPQMLVKHNIWREMNPRETTFLTLQQELSLSYNKMDFLEDDDLMCASHMSPVRNKERKDNRKFDKSKSMIDDELLPRQEGILFGIEPEDDEEELLISRLFKGDAMEESKIEKNVNDIYSLVTESIFEDDFMGENCITEAEIIAELKRIEGNILSGNFIGNGEEINGCVEYLPSSIPEMKAKVMEPRKKEVVKENKVKMLEQLMKKNFSQGGRSHISEI